MNKIALSSESGLDLPIALLDEFEISTIPFTIILGEKEYKDNVDITIDEVLAYNEKSSRLAKTSAINEDEYAAYFSKLLENNESILHIAMSSGLSTSYYQAEKAAERFEGRVKVIDSKSLSLGIALLCLYAKKLINKGLSLLETFEKVVAKRAKLHISFVVEKLEGLYKGGRCSGLAMLGANILKIRPELVANEEGKLAMGKKFLGKRSKWVPSFLKETLKKMDNVEEDICFIGQLGIEEEHLSSIKSSLLSRGFQRVEDCRLGTTVGSYSWEGTLGIVYFDK